MTHRTGGITAQAPTVAPPKRKTGTKPSIVPGQEETPDIIFKPNRDLEQEYLDFISDENNDYMLILYNDNLNKRQYVQTQLQEVH